MHLAGQDETDRRAPQAGYAMAALIVGLTVMAVMMTVAMPVWTQAARREKEAELVFRGEQIARSIGLFQRKFANAYPPTLDVLVEQKFLRKKYKDPITNDDFVPITQGQQAAGTPGGAQGTARGAQPQGQTPAAGGRGGQVGGAPGTPGGAPAGGVIGVTSKSKDVSIRLYKGRSHYNEWAFTYTPPAATAGAGGQGQQGQRGRQGQPNQPGTNPLFPGPGGNPGRGGRGPTPPSGPGGRGPNGGSPFNPFGPGQPSPFPSPPGRGR